MNDFFENPIPTAWRAAGLVVGIGSLALTSEAQYHIDGNETMGCSSGGLSGLRSLTYSIPTGLLNMGGSVDAARRGWTNMTDMRVSITHLSSGGELTVQDYSDFLDDRDGYYTEPDPFTLTCSYIDFNYDATSGYTSTQNDGLAKHEFGHAMGLGHCNTTANVMWADTAGRANVIGNHCLTDYYYYYPTP